MSTKICMHCHVRGRVQGVAFRYYTHKEAQKLGINGWAKNLKDGRVEVLACGEASAVERFALWLHQGPPAARVEEVNCTKTDSSLCPTDFTVG